VRLSDEETERLEALIRKATARPAVAEGENIVEGRCSDRRCSWSDSRIIKALDTQRFPWLPGAEGTGGEGFEAVLSRKQRATPAVARIFDGEKEAK